MNINSYPSLKNYKARENTGSRSSNRLAMQISFAMWKIFELYRIEDFTVAMDCIDDVVLFKTSNKYRTIVTYQLKTKDSTTGNFELKKLINDNVFLKMYDHIEKIDKDVEEIYLITNNPLKFKKKMVHAERILFDDLDTDIKELIKENMSGSPVFADKGLSTKFIYSLIDMSFHNHREISQNRLNSLLMEEGIDISITAADALFNTLQDILTNKQNYEFSLQDKFNTVLNKKSFSKMEFASLLESSKNINADVLSFEDIVNKYYKDRSLSLKEESLYRRAMASVKEKLNKSPNILQNINADMYQFVKEQIDTNEGLMRSELVILLQSIFDDKVNHELSKEEREILYMQNIETVLREG
ncbi:dsDNA nuclease domain-containing protein [Bacillus altitudinis]|uniref:Lamassu anti-phage system protein LmuA n=1 Tax=Bacillus altitudinis TaxID=293387 RepID=UPI002DB8D5F0|nr:Lamassu anti-phage system protein LmuA [Bacillus altitudinis]MEC1011014.1 dsDNA nuclease domain-containing protein [Bacillus altitudinis]